MEQPLAGMDELLGRPSGGGGLGSGDGVVDSLFLPEGSRPPLETKGPE